jgi:DNA topoisomerase-3
MDLKKLIEKQVQDHAWGGYAQTLLRGGFKQPRGGRHNDQAHPPIHPVNHVASHSLADDERRVYEFVVRRFLACCSEDATGESTTVEIQYGDETFSATGLIVLERNYLDVYPYEKWTSSQPLPKFTLNESFEPTGANITEGETTTPGYLTEPELISLMDANGIGTDATMADHIAKIKEREYVMTQPRTGGAQTNGINGRGNRERRGGRGGSRGASSAGGAGRGGGGESVQQFIPTTLGVALIEGYDGIGLETSLGKPFLRKEMEIKMKEICAGTKSRNDFVHETLEMYKAVFVRTQQQVGVLKAASDCITNKWICLKRLI